MESADGRGEFVKAGYLVKSPPVNRALVAQWHRRWFLLMDSKLVYPLAERYVRLVYYQSEADAKRLADPKGSINLNSCLSVVSLNEPIKQYKFVFDVCTNERVYHLAADSEEERSEWVSTLKQLLYPSQPQNGTNTHALKAAGRKSPEVVSLRSKGNPKVLRPLSFTGGINSESKPRVQSRPLPPVPDNAPSSGTSSSPGDRKNRPLPPPPSESTHQGIHIHPVGFQSSPLLQQRKLPPPTKPPPYRKNKSDPNPPPSSLAIQPPSSKLQQSESLLSPPSHTLLAEDYQEFVSQSPVGDFIGELAMEDNYSLATSVPRQQPQDNAVPKPSRQDEDYSVLESTAVHGYNPADKDYSHLEPTKAVVSDSPPPPIRHSSLAPHHMSDTSLHKPQPQVRPKPSRQRPYSAVPDYVNFPASPDSTNEDYCHLRH